MKEILLKQKDYSTIKNIAVDNYSRKLSTDRWEEDFLCRCYVEAVKEFIASKGWTIENGKVYKK